ncbi:MAG: ABC transporter ATP-binding protein [Anaerolineales bacterium]
MSAIRIEGLRKTYAGVTALDGLDLQVETGAIFGFLGPNGAGKTTTIRLLTGLAQPSQGRAWVADVEVTPGAGRGLQRVARKIGHLPEEPAFYNWMTPREFLDHVARLFGLNAAERTARVEELLGLVGLASVAKRRIGGFSRGMRQRLGLAQALVNQPPVLFLDEPASALDPAGRKEVLSLIESLRGRCTVFMSTHILADVERVCDSVGIIANGRMIAQGASESLLERYAVPAFELEADAGGEAALAAWVETQRAQPWLASAAVNGLHARLQVSDMPAAKHALLPAAVAAGLVLNRYEMVKPSLEDVFLRLVGEAGG